MRREDGAMLAFVGVAAAIARLPGLGARGLWVDEAFTAIAASRTPSELIELLRTDSGPPLYYLLMGVITTLFGVGESALRAPSAVAGIASAMVLTYTARRLGATRTASLVAGALVALSPLLVYHAQDARYYAFLPLVATLVLLALERALERGAPARWAGVSALLIVAMYLHNYGLLLVPAIYAYALLRGRPPWRPLSLAALVAVIAYAPWVPVLLDQLRFGGTAWAAREFELSAPLASLEAFVPGGRTPAHVVLPPGVPRVFSVLAGLLIAGATVWSAWRARDAARPILACLGFALVPLLIAWVVSAIWQPIYVVGRADVVFLPGIAVAAALGLSRLRRWSQRVAVGLVVALGVAAILPYHRTDVKSGDRTLARAVARAARPGDVAIACGLAYPPLTYYLSAEYAGDDRLTLLPFPLEMEHHPGNVDARATLARGSETFAAFDRALAAHLAAAGPDVRVWAVLPPGPLGQALGRHLDARMTRVGSEGGFRMGILGTPIHLVAWTPGREGTMGDGAP